MNNNEYSLYHYGVPGMRWGKRKGNTTNDKTTKKSKSRKALKVGAIAAGTALAAVGIYKLSQSNSSFSKIGSSAVKNILSLNSSSVKQLPHKTNPYFSAKDFHSKYKRVPYSGKYNRK